MGSRTEGGEAVKVRVLVACERSGVVRDAFRAMGADAWSCDLAPSEVEGQHLQCDVREVLGESWDLLVAHPECRFLCVSGLHWSGRRPGRALETEAAIAFARVFFDATHIPFRAVENPVGVLSTVIRRPDQILQPWQFGADASKATCLWLYGLPALVPVRMVAPRLVASGGKWLMRWANQTDSGQNRLSPGPARAVERSRTYSGVAAAMAAQWFPVVERAVRREVCA